MFVTELSFLLIELIELSGMLVCFDSFYGELLSETVLDSTLISSGVSSSTSSTVVSIDF